jgi:beta-lactamase regulating signal transducer with metallopeptidase domain
MTSALQPFAQIAIERVLNSLPEGLLIAFFAWAALRLLPKQNSRTRFAVWFVALISVVSLPWIPALLQRHFFDSATNTFALPAVGLSAITMPAHWATILLIAWALVVFIMTVRLGIGLWQLHQLRQTCRPVDLAQVDPSIRVLVTELNSRKSFLARPVTLAVSDHLRVPTAIGLWKPMVVVPSWALRELPASELSVILHHEFAHLRHWDDWTNFLQKLVRVFFFFHPAVWWIEKRLSVEREMACDDVVVAETGNPTGYASCLVSLLERSLAQRGWTMAQALVHRAREASMRLARILDPKRPTATRISRPALAMLGTFTVLCLVMAPNTPQVISFEQSSQRNINHESVASAESVPVNPGLFHDAGWHDSSLPTTAISASTKTKAASHPFTSRAKILNAAPKDSAEIATTKSVSRDDEVARQQPVSDLLAERSFVAAVSNVLFDETFDESFDQTFDKSFLADPGLQSASPMFVVMQATEFVVPMARPDGTPHPLVWRVQVWRVSVINATWKHKAVVPPAHST